ncbi:TPA: hypothetical protein ACH3X3_011296 [Trebouxia sp. C0006]
MSSFYCTASPTVPSCGSIRYQTSYRQVIEWLHLTSRALDSLTSHKMRAGHDWGAAVAWQLAGRFPKRFERLVALSVGHNASMFSMGGNRQREKSWYMLFFKFREVSEEALQRNNWALMRQLWFTDEPQVAEDYIADLSRPGALTAALNWYRANVQLEQFGDTQPRPAPLLRCPVLGVWSSRDAGVLEEQMTASARYVMHIRFAVF